MNDTKSTILKVAILLFSEQGYNGVSMRNIADAVKISAPALYNHFADKKSLYEAAVAHNFESKSELLLPVLTLSEKPMLRLQRFIEQLCQQMSDDAEFRRLIQWELLNEDKGRLEYLAIELFAPLFGGMMDLLKELKPDEDAHLLAVIIFGMIQKPYEVNTLSSFFAGSKEIHSDPTYISQHVMKILSSYLGESQ